MSNSIIQFARDFEKFKSILEQKLPVSVKCGMFENTWYRLAEFKDNRQFAVFSDEFKYLFRAFFVLKRLKRIDLDRLETFLKIAGEAGVDEVLTDIHFAIARLLFFVGDIENALKHIELVTGKKLNVDFDDVFRTGYDEYDLFSSVYELSKDAHPEIHDLLKKIRIEWDGSRESIDYEGAKCLLVEKNNRGEVIGGKIETLAGHASLFDTGHKADELSFNEQLKTPDDKFVGVIYQSFEAVRKIFKSQRQKDKAEGFVHAHFHLEKGQEEYTGDSIGLAAGLLTYVQLIKPDTTRYDKYITSNVAFTGSIDADGNILPVNEDTLKQKIGAAFFSPIKYVVLPSANLKAAQTMLESLTQSYPHRKLHFIAIDNLHDVITNHNIIRDEKLCLGPYLARKVKKHSLRSAAAFSLIFILANYSFPSFNRNHFIII